jgi:hypothetical protein
MAVGTAAVAAIGAAAATWAATVAIGAATEAVTAIGAAAIGSSETSLITAAPFAGASVINPRRKNERRHPRRRALHRSGVLLSVRARWHVALTPSEVACLSSYRPPRADRVVGLEM